ncbi:hypothetical protein C7W93_23100 [Glaciimonas sp. PCH181]|nr:hypothetical protein C7W93_23100 [Glaciimonas sp. PCH181]
MRRDLGLIFFKIIGCLFFNNLEEVKISSAVRQHCGMGMIVSNQKVLKEFSKKSIREYANWKTLWIRQTLK